MSEAAVQSVLRDTMGSEEILDRFRADPDGVLDDYDLNEEEREMLKSGRVSEASGDLGATSLVVTITILL